MGCFRQSPSTVLPQIGIVASIAVALRQSLFGEKRGSDSSAGQRGAKSLDCPAAWVHEEIVWRLCRVRHRRNTCRSWLDETGAPMKVQQELMRHASIQTTTCRALMRLESERGVCGRETSYKMSVMLESGVDISPVITHRFRYLDFEKGFDAIISWQTGKVMETNPNDLSPEPPSPTPELKDFINRILVPILVDRYLKEQRNDSSQR
jgi:hypothetical protein